MPTRNPRIVVIGSLNVDLTTVIDRMPEPGETIFGREFNLGFGGKGGNQAAAARLCGADVAMVARVGDDLFGPATIADLDAFGIETSHVLLTAGVSTGVAPIFIDEAGQNRILVVKGANDHLASADVDRARDVIASSDVVILQLEVPLETVYYALDVARSLGVPSILNPAPARPLEAKRAASATYLIPNEIEAAVLNGDADFERVIITLGSEGARYRSGSEAFHVPAIAVETVDTSGAGDAFIGSFAYCLASGEAVRDAIWRANVYAGLSVTKPGTRRAFPTREEWSSRLDRL